MKKISSFIDTIITCAMIISGAMMMMFTWMWTIYYVMDKYLWHNTKLSYKEYMKTLGIETINNL